MTSLSTSRGMPVMSDASDIYTNLHVQHHHSSITMSITLNNLKQLSCCMQQQLFPVGHCTEADSFHSKQWPIAQRLIAAADLVSKASGGTGWHFRRQEAPLP